MFFNTFKMCWNGKLIEGGDLDPNDFGPILKLKLHFIARDFLFLVEGQ